MSAFCNSQMSESTLLLHAELATSPECPICGEVDTCDEGVHLEHEMMQQLWAEEESATHDRYWESGYGVKSRGQEQEQKGVPF